MNEWHIIYLDLGSCCSVTQSCLILCDPMDCTHQASLSFTISQSLLKLRSIESVMLSKYLILCCSLLLLSSIFPSIRVFSSESTLHIRWPKYWSFSCSINPSKEYSGLIPFRIDSFVLLAVQRMLKSLLQPRLDTWDKCSDLVHWEDPEGSGGEGGGRGDQDGEYMSIQGWFMSMYDKNHYNIVK